MAKIIVKSKKKKEERGIGKSFYLTLPAARIVDDIAKRSSRTRSRVISKIVEMTGPSIQADLTLLHR